MLDSSEVNLKADFLFFEDKLDHAATLRELRRVTDGQNRLFVEGFDDLVIWLPSAELMKTIRQLAASCGLEIRLATTLCHLWFHLPACIEGGPKRILAENRQ